MQPRLNPHSRDAASIDGRGSGADFPRIIESFLNGPEVTSEVAPEAVIEDEAPIEILTAAKKKWL